MTMRLPLNLAICALSVLAAQSLVSAALAQAPHYEADVNWPKPLPDRWVTGGLGDGTVKGPPSNSSTAPFFMPPTTFVARDNGDVYVSAGESRGGNRRVAVFDANGKFLRQWLPEGMDTVHCMTIANDGTVYVCNRGGSRIQLYDKMGNFKKSIDLPWKPYTVPADDKIEQSGGATVALHFSHHSDQILIFTITQT